MGELAFEQKAQVTAVDTALQEQQQDRAAEALRVATPGGRFHVRWDEGGSATALGQLAFFAEFLEVSGLFARWMDGCPMAYTSPNAPAARETGAREKPGPDHGIASVASVSTALSSMMTGFHR